MRVDTSDARTANNQVPGVHWQMQSNHWATCAVLHMGVLTCHHNLLAQQ
jgi:hypothetical protein